MAGFKMLVLIAVIATNAPKRYEPPSPRKIFALGKLNLRNIIKIKHKKYFIEGWMWHPERESKLNQFDIRIMKKFLL